MSETILSRAIQQARDAMPAQTGSCKWCFPTPNEHANYHCLCSMACDSGHCPMSSSGYSPMDGCGVPVELSPVPVFRV